MDGIKLLLLLVASAQVEAGTEYDYGWQVNKDDGVLEYIVQINEDKKRAMELPSKQYPHGAENSSNMPRELVGRASRVVVRFGNEILPREPSLQELDRTQRLFEQPSVSAAAVLGEDKFRNIESPVRNIQGQGTTPAFPAIPNGLSGPTNPVGSLADQLSQAGNSVRSELTDRLSDALSDASMGGRSLPDPGLLAQNTAGQLGGASAFLNETKGPLAGGANSKFNSTAQPANPPANPPLSNSSSTRLPDYPPTGGANAPFASANPPTANTANSRSSLGTGFGANNSTAPLYPTDRLNPPSLNTQNAIPQQRTPSSTFGTSPGLANASNDWVTTNPAAPNYAPSMSQPTDKYNFGAQTNLPPGYTAAPNLNEYQNPTHIASNPTPYAAPSNTNPPASPTNSGALTRQQLENALAVQSKFDKNKDGVLTPDEYTPASVDGILLTLFVVSLLVNLYLGHLIRKLLMRYRLVLTNVRSQAAYT
jgi:hypothetical protein